MSRCLVRVTVEGAFHTVSKSWASLVRISAKSVSLYAGENQVTFVVSGKRFRKDGTLGKLNETMTFSFEIKGRT